MIEKLVLSKNELINLNLTNILNISKSNDSFECKETNVNNLLNLSKNDSVDRSNCFSHDNIISINDQFKTQVQVVQIAARQLLE